jgi:multidrug resistance protein MdtO
MAAGASSLASSSSSLDWLRNFVREELAPYPGRGARVARMVIAATIVMLLNLTFRVPYGAYGAAYALILSRESTEATVAEARNTVIAFSGAVLYALVSAACVAGDPVLRLLWVLGSLFLVFFATRAIQYQVAARFGYLLIVTIPVWDQEIPAEQKVVLTLWAIFALSFSIVITAVIELIYARLFPLDNLTGALIERLNQVASLLHSLAKGMDDPAARHQVARLAILGTSRMRRDLIRSFRSPETADKMGAVVALVGRLVDLAANVSVLSRPLPKEECPGIEQLAGRIEAIAANLRDARSLPGLESFEDLDLCHNPPLLLEMEKTVKLIAETLSGSESLGGYYAPPQQVTTSRRLLAADAFSNPEYIRFALRGSLAAGACYLTYNLIAWPGISTAVTTCFLTALTTVGSSRQKQILRFGGAVIGGVIFGFGAQVFILPGIESIAGFTVLFVLFTALASWVATSSARLSYLGIQMAIAFYLINLQEFKFQTSLAVTRDRVAGVFLGLLAMWCIFDQLWAAPAAIEMQRTFVSALRLMAKLMRAPVAGEPAAATEEVYSLRETIDTNFEKLRQQADGVMLEFGRERERNLELRARLLRWQLQLRIIFLVRTTLVKYRLHLPGFELPEPVRRSQENFDAETAQRLESLAGLVSGTLTSSAAAPGTQQAVRQNHFAAEQMASSVAAFPGLRSFYALSARFDSLLTSLENEIAGNP